jgi:hypothetical protein
LLGKYDRKYALPSRSTDNPFKLRKMSACSGSIKRQEVDEFLVILRASSGAHPPEKEP